LSQIRVKAGMNSLFKKLRKRSRGIVGIEAAIVLIAFVVIAASMAYVVINMGFFAAQQAKSTIGKGIQEATSALELDGFVTGETNSSNVAITYLAIPLKLSIGQDQVDLSNSTVVVAVQCGNFSLANVYGGVRASTDASIADLMASVTGAPNATCFIYNSKYSTDTALKQNAKAYLVINLGDTYGLVPYTKVKIEIRTGVGAALMIQRNIPGGLEPNSMIDLG
jgi:flagellin FlaB